MPIFDSIPETHRALTDVGYITDEATAAAVFFAARENRSLLIEGPAGAGKTELALSVAKAGNMPFIRLQCYQGIGDKQAIGDFDHALQDLFVDRESRSGKLRSFDDLAVETRSRKFFNAGPLLEALESETRCVLLIDEIDKVDYAFEAFLLEMLSVWQHSIPRLGVVRAKTVPFVVITSNAEREIGFALRRRCLYTMVEHPTAAREAEIVARQTPHSNPAMHRFIAGLAIALRRESLEKPPSISEMNSVALALELMGQTEIQAEHKMLFLPLLVKTKNDREQLVYKEGMFRNIVDDAKKFAAAMTGSQVEQALRLDGPAEEASGFLEEISKGQDVGTLPKEDKMFFLPPSSQTRDSIRQYAAILTDPQMELGLGPDAPTEILPAFVDERSMEADAEVVV
ncbi:MAG: AAA family ATPase [Acidobacteriaceae bacterium]